MESNLYEKGVLENRVEKFSLLRALFAGTPEPPKDWVLFVDLSHWNGICNFPLMNSKGVRGGITKATDIGWGTRLGFVDSKAIHNYTEMGKVGWLRGGYHWLDPRHGSPQYQAAYYLENFYNRYHTEVQPVMDFEDNDFTDPLDMLWRAKVWLETVKQATGRVPWVYTSNGYMSRFPKSAVGFLAEYPLWDAHYIQRGYPTVPYPWKKAIAWQYSDRGHYPYYQWNSGTMHGREWGSGSSYLDMNWWMGTYEEFLAFCGEVELPEPVEPEDVLFQAKCIADSLYKRLGSNMSFPTAGYLVRNQVVDVYEVATNGWFRIDPVKSIWCSGYFKYMERVSDPVIIPDPKPVIPTLEVPLYSQKDSRWATDKLGTSSTTIGGYGCLITAAAMICKYYGKDTDPKKMNQDLNRVGGYANGNLLKFSSVTKIYPDISVDWSNYLASPQSDAIDAVLKRHIPVIVQVDFKPATTALDQHWVIIVGKNANGYVIADPIDGKLGILSKYANKAFRMVVYAQAESGEVLFQAKCITHSLYIRSTAEYFKDKRNVVGVLWDGNVRDVYEERFADNINWYRIGTAEWCSGYYMEKVQ